MGVSIVVGGQFGSEGKGKVTHYFAKKLQAKAVIKVGGINSGHTVVDCGKKLIFRNLPVSASIDNVYSVIPAGSYIDPAMLLNEIAESGCNPAYLKINPNAVVLGDEHKNYEHSIQLNKRIGSTGSGTGSGVMQRILRGDDVKFAKNHPLLKDYLCDTTKFLREILDKGEEVIIEGTQGYGLSVLHSEHYPYVTSRDTNSAGFLSEAGLSPFDVTNIILVIRSYPIRVAGNSGPLPNEITWEELAQQLHVPVEQIKEKTTVTKKVRRVAHFDSELVRKAIQVNKPNKIVLNHADYWDYTCHNSSILSRTIEEKIQTIEKEIGNTIDLVGTGEAVFVERN